MKRCVSCGFINEDGVLFCGGCGAGLGFLKNKGEMVLNRFKIEKVLGGDIHRWVYNVLDVSSGKYGRLIDVYVREGIEIVLEKSAIDIFIKNGVSLIKRVGRHIFVYIENIEGIVSIDKLVKNGGALSQETALDVTLKILNLLNLFHSLTPPLVFGDIDSHTFGVLEDGSVLFYDVGGGVLVGRGKTNFLQMRESNFVAPEVFLGGKQRKEWDIYSVGAICYFMVTGRYFKGDFSQLKSRLGEGINLVLKMLARNPKERYPISYIIQRIERILGRGEAYTHLNRAISFYHRGDFEQAFREIENFLVLGGSCEMGYFWRGIFYKAKGDFERSEKNFNMAINLDGNYESAYYERGKLFLEEEEYSKALEDFNKAISLNPLSYLYYLGRADALMGLGKFSRAIEDYTKAISMEPYLLEGYRGRAESYFYLEEFENAIRDYEKCIEIDGEDFLSYTGLAVVEAIVGDKDKALEYIEKAISVNPKYGYAYMEKGIILLEKRMFEEALECFNRALNLNDALWEDLLFYKASAEYEMGMYNKALEDLDKVVKLKPKFKEAYLLRSKVRQRLGDIDGSVEDEKVYRRL